MSEQKRMASEIMTYLYSMENGIWVFEGEENDKCFECGENLYRKKCSKIDDFLFCYPLCQMTERRE